MGKWLGLSLKTCLQDFPHSPGNLCSTFLFLVLLLVCVVFFCLFVFFGFNVLS